ncbi:hypothetical protein [Haloarcula litorea]|uniref:hypothetical protein n=1 Tax=Haloarcula litorea TaxID=3032579 RepID=UPI0023E7B0A2|nr:hypothetical protein [Halomicroarcula sp. GDY20]
MALDVPVPDPPALDGPQSRDAYQSVDAPEADPGDDYRREELAEVLAAGGWYDAFDEWAAHTALTEAEFEVVTDADLIQGFDFYWDPSTDDVGYQSPTLPDDVRADLGTGDADEIETELDDLGRVVTETLENDYLQRDDETFGFFADDAPEETFDYEDDDLGEGL